MKNITNSVLIIAALLASVLLTFSYADGQPLSPVTSSVERAMPAPADAASASAATPSAAANATAPKNLVEKSQVETIPEGRKLVARVVWVKGKMNAEMPGGKDKRALKTAANIYMNDTLVTEANSEGQIIFTDNSTMTFRPDTKLYINEYNYIPKSERKVEKKSAGRYVLDLVTGGFRTITGLVAKENPNDYQVNTPVATIGVRGTEYSLVYKQGQDLYIKRYTGEPCMTNNAKSDNKKLKKSAVGGGGAAANGATNEICLNELQQYGYVANENTNPVAMVAQPEVFRTDVEIIPVTFSDLSTSASTSSNITKRSEERR